MLRYMIMMIHYLQPLGYERVFYSVAFIIQISRLKHPNEVYLAGYSLLMKKTWLQNPMGKDGIFPLILEQVSC